MNKALDQEVKNVLARDMVERREKYVNTKLYLLENKQTNKIRKLEKTIKLISTNRSDYNIDTGKAYDWLSEKYKVSPLLLEEFGSKGELVVAGGSIVKAMYGIPHNYYTFKEDIDFFINGCTEIRAHEILRGCILLLHKNLEFQFHKLHVTDDPILSTYVRRNSHAVSVILRLSIEDSSGYRYHEKEIHYQFILRLYPNIPSIIGGFDIGLCMLVWSMNNNKLQFSSNHLGKWCLENSAIIVDTSRRSKSYESRLSKYTSRCGNIILPGVHNGFKISVKKETSTNEIVNIINDFLEEGIQILEDDDDYDDDYYDYDYNYERCFRFVNETKFKQSTVSRHELIQSLNLTAKNHGWYIDNIDISIDWEYVNLTDNINQEELVIRINNYISQYGFLLEYNEYNKYIFNTIDIYHNLLPVDKYGCMVKIKSTDKVKQEHVERYSDYSMSYMWPQNTYKCNGKMLRMNKSENVVSCFEVEQHDDILEAFEKYLNNPNIGDVNIFIKSFYKSCDYWEGEQYKTYSYENNKEKFKNVKKFIIHLVGDYAQECIDSGFISDEIKDLVVERIKRNYLKAKENLTGIKWYTENPSSQMWTSSFNPIFEDPREWYGEENYVPFLVEAIPQDIETVLRLGRRDKNSPLSWLYKDIFKYLLKHVAYAYVGLS